MTLEIQVLAWEGESVCTSVRGPATQEGVRESLKGPITLVIHVLFWLFEELLLVAPFQDKHLLCS
jgi:hypothetical protein